MARIPLLDLVQDSKKPPAWILPDILAQDSIICLAGVAGIGKSVFCYALSIAVAAELPFLGRQTVQRKVLYLDEENGPANQPTYFTWAWRGLGSPNLESLESSLRIERQTIYAYQGRWADAIAEISRECRPGLIILDTTTPICRIKDENDNAEATRIIQALRYIQAAAGAHTTIIALRHARVEKERGAHGEVVGVHRKMRGATAWEGSTDGVLFHLGYPGASKRDGLRTTYLTSDKTRAFGLREDLIITPHWVYGPEGEKGLELAGNFAPQVNLSSIESTD